MGAPPAGLVFYRSYLMWFRISAGASFFLGKLKLECLHAADPGLLVELRIGQRLGDSQCFGVRMIPAFLRSFCLPA